MKIKRHPIARGTVAELQSFKPIGPEEAAAAAGAKFGAITEGLKTIGEVGEAIAGIKAQAELNNAISDTDDALLKIDQDIDKMPAQLDAQGNVIFDAEQVIEVEQGAREAIIGAVREGLSTASARRAYDKHVLGLNMDRNKAYQQAQIKREKQTLEANSENRNYKLLQEGRHNDALMQARQDVVTGVIGVDTYNDRRREIRLDRDIKTVTRVALDPDATDTEIQLMIDSLKDGEWSSALGFEEPQMELNETQRLQWQGRMFEHMNGVDGRGADARKAAQDAATMGILPEVVQGNLAPVDVANLDHNIYGVTGIKYLMTQARAAADGVKSHQPAMEKAYDLILELMVEGGGTAMAETIKALIKSDDRIVGKDQIGLLKEVDTAVNNVSAMQPQRRVLDAELVKLQGLTSLEEGRDMTDDRRSERIAGEEMERDFWAEAENLRSAFTVEWAQKWIDDNKVKYYKIALSDTLLSRGIPLGAMPENRDEAERYIKARVVINQQKELGEYWDELDDVEKAQVITDEMLQIEMLMRHVWTEQ